MKIRIIHVPKTKVAKKTKKVGTNKQGRFFALSTNNQSNQSLNAPRTLPRTVSRDSDVERSLRGLTDDEQSIHSRTSIRSRNKSKGNTQYLSM